jgi:hypothetical protein
LGACGRVAVTLARAAIAACGAHPVLYVTSLEQSFQHARARKEILPFLERAPEWIPSGTTLCRDTTLALFRGPRPNVVCAARDQRSRCFAFAASPTGRLQVDVARGYGDSSPDCAVDTTLAFGPDLELGHVPLGRFPLGAHSDYSRRNDPADGDTVETATSLVQEWRYVHEAPLCIRVSGASAHREILREVPHSTTPRRSTFRQEYVPIVYGAAPTSLPRMAPAMASPEVGGAIPDLRGSWRLEGESWTRVPSCKAN